jgi:hypothetical protein
MNFYFASRNPNKVVCMYVFLIKNTHIVAISDSYTAINIKNIVGDVMPLDCFFSSNVVIYVSLCVYRCYVILLNLDR